MARLVRVLKNIEDIQQDADGRVRFILKSAKKTAKPWIKMNRGNVRAIKDHRYHDPFPVINPGLYELKERSRNG